MTETNQKNEAEFVAVVGIDCADQKRAWALQVVGDLNVERGALDHKPETVDEWAAQLAQRFAGRPMPWLEQARGSLFMLTK